MSLKTDLRAMQPEAQNIQIGGRNYMTESHSDPMLSDSINMHTNSNGSIATIIGAQIPPGTEVVPINFGIKYKPPKLGLQYHLPDQPMAQFVYEVNL
jgi:hypothetical protein